jgi:hypothetical protein
MKLTKAERNFLSTFAGIAHKLLNGVDAKTTKRTGRSRTRRSAADVAKMKKQIRAARKKKVPVAQIAKQLGVTPSYIYQLER